MTVAFDAFTNGGVAATSPSWTHTPSGTPRAAIVVCLGTTFDALSFTYGGVAMGAARVTIDNTVAGELQFLRASIFMLDNVSSGAQTVAFTGGTTQVKLAHSYTVTAGDEVEFVDSDQGESTAVANPSGTLSLGGRDSWACIGFASGQDAVTGVTPLTDWTSDAEVDNGTTTQGFYSYDTVASTDITAGWTQASEDAMYVSMAIAEIASASVAPQIIHHLKQMSEN